MLRSGSVWISLVAVLLLILGPLLAFIGLVSGLQGLALYGLAALVGLIGAVAGIVSAVRGRIGPGLVAVAIGLGALVIVLYPAFAASGRPRINDISTDLEEVPGFLRAGTWPENRGRDMKYPEEFKPIVREAWPNLTSLRVNAEAREVFEQALALAREQPRWEITVVDAPHMRFEGVVETRVFRFRDDFIVRVRREGEGTRVDMRSKSRVGKGDLGANAARIEQFFQALAPRVGAEAEKAEPGR